jgi:hypothetical protein
MRGAPAQGEAIVVWALLALDAVAVLITYSVIEPSELYNVSREGLSGGLSRALVQLNYPVALAAIPIALLALDVLSRRAWLVGAPAIALCAFVAWPGVLDQDDLDARAVNALPAVGVALVFGLTVAAARRAGTSIAPRRSHDGLRLVTAAVLLLVALPWIAAELGRHFPPVVFLTDQLYAEPGEAPRAAVHLGHHHGLAGTLLVLSALLLSRPRLIDLRLQRVYAALLCVMVTYGVANIVNDAWHEQVLKRGWTSWDVPSATEPRLHVIWALVLMTAVILYALGFGRGDGVVASSDNHAR